VDSAGRRAHLHLQPDRPGPAAPARLVGHPLGHPGRPGDPATAPPGSLFEDGLLSEASFGAAWSNSRRYANSVSREEGRTLSLRLRVAGQATGSDYDLWRARAAWSEYLRLPATRHAVLAARLSGALAHGSLGGSPPYTLGGVSQPGLIDLFLLQTFSASDQLRGYPAGAQAGNGIALLNLELRFPLVSPEAGSGLVPVFLRRLHGAVFADVGEAFVHGSERGYAGPDFQWERLRFGAGAELRLETALAYWLLTDLRLGVARGLGRLLAGQGPDDDPLAEWQVYLTFGPSF
jgi:outer membrane protein assembly factor BamA